MEQRRSGGMDLYKVCHLTPIFSRAYNMEIECDGIGPSYRLAKIWTSIMLLIGRVRMANDTDVPIDSSVI